MRCFFFELENLFRVFRVQKRIVILRIFNPKLRLIALRCVYIKIDRALKNEFYYFSVLIFEFHNKSFVIPFYIFDIKCSARVVYFIFFKAFHIIPSPLTKIIRYIYIYPFFYNHFFIYYCSCQDNCIKKAPHLVSEIWGDHYFFAFTNPFAIASSSVLKKQTFTTLILS